MTYLVMDNLGHRIVTADNLRKEIDAGSGEIRIFRLCDMKDPKELFLRFFGNEYFIVDCYGNIEEGV